MISLSTIALTAFALLLFFIARVVLAKLLSMNTRLDNMEKAINAQLAGESIDSTIEQKLETKLELMRKKALEQYADMREKMTKQAAAATVAPAAAAPVVSAAATFPVVLPPQAPPVLIDEPRAPIRKVPHQPLDVTPKIRRVLPQAPIRIEEPVVDTEVVKETAKPPVDEVHVEARIEEIETVDEIAGSSENATPDAEAPDTEAPDTEAPDTTEVVEQTTDGKVKVERGKRRKKV